MSLVSGQEVANFLGRGDDAELVALATEHEQVVEMQVRAYVRGFDQLGTDALDEIGSVITGATARSVMNPDGNVREQIGDYSVVPFQGFTVAEQFTLNRYRKRAL